METVGYLIGFLTLIAFACYGVVWETRRYKQLIKKDKEQEELYQYIKLYLIRNEIKLSQVINLLYEAIGEVDE